MRKFFENVKAQLAVVGIFVAAVTVAVGSVVGLSLAAKSKDVFDHMNLATEANTAMSNTVSTIYSSWPLSGLIVLALFGATALGAFMYFKIR